MSKKVQIIRILQTILMILIFFGIIGELILRELPCYILVGIHVCIVYAYFRGRNDGMNKIEKFYSSIFDVRISGQEIDVDKDNEEL